MAKRNLLTRKILFELWVGDMFVFPDHDNGLLGVTRIRENVVRRFLRATVDIEILRRLGHHR